jgi:large subunit ribosomal protein L13
MTTYVAKPAEVERKWWVVDATDQPLGRLASQVASVLRGKHKTIFTPHMDAGDFVIVINAEKVKLTGNKLDGKLYITHSGIPGGYKERTYRWMLDNRATVAVSRAVTGMLPKGPLGRQVATKLKVYTGSTHPHAAQQPAAMNLQD